MDIIPIDQVKKVFVYGSLKEGFGNHRVMERSNGRYIGVHHTDAEYTMVSLHSFPGVVLGGDTSIKGEVYEVDHLTHLDRLEGYPSFYNRKIIYTEYGPAWMYFLADRHQNIDQYKKVTSGEWTAG